MTVKGALVSTVKFCMIDTRVRLNSSCAALGEQRVYQTATFLAAVSKCHFLIMISIHVHQMRILQKCGANQSEFGEFENLV